MVTKRTLLYKEHSFGERRYPRDTRKCGCSNSVCIHRVTDRERANHLLEYANDLRENGWPDIKFLPLRENKRGTVIQGTSELDSCDLDSDETRNRLVTPEEAARRIREDGVRGFFVYCDREDHGPEGLVILDRDEPDQWPDTPDTLRVISGSGESDHLYYRNDGSVERAKAKGDRSGAGSVRGRNWGIVVPGSIHIKSDGIYHLAANPGVATLSSSDLQDPFLPSAGTTGSGEHTYEGLDDPDENAVEVVQEAIINFRCHSETSWKAIEYFEDLRDGKNLREHGFIPDDRDNTNGCRHEANLTLATLLHGMLLMNGETDRDRNRWLIHQYLAHIARQHPRTDRGQRRKLLISDKYISDRASVAIENFDHQTFQKWMRKIQEYNFTGEYSPIMEDRVLLATETLARGDGPYPSRADVAELCHEMDDSRTTGSYGKCLRQVAGDRVKQAHCGGNDYRYYPLGMDDPEDAIAVKPGMWE